MAGLDSSAAKWLQPVQPVEPGHLVRLGHRRIVEDGVAEVVDRAAEGEHGLADMDDLGRALAEDVDAEELPGLPVKEDLQETGVDAEHLALGELLELREADLVRHLLLRQLLLGLA